MSVEILRLIYLSILVTNTVAQSKYQSPDISLTSCPVRPIDSNLCWGYEKSCTDTAHIKYPVCSKMVYRDKGEREAAAHKFWMQGDFGFVRKLRDESIDLCVGKKRHDSSFTCSPYMTFCRTKNLYIDFTKVQFGGRDSFKKIPFGNEEIGGHCKLDKTLLRKQTEKFKVNLMSWITELEDYSALSFRPIKDKKCDDVIKKPVIFVKLDHGGNMYHHFCDFINIYISQHINGSNFNKDVFIMNWDVTKGNYNDKFADGWHAFTDHPLRYIREFSGKRVCFRDAMFSVPPRYPPTLFYSMQLQPDCGRSSLMRAFSEHVLNRLGIKREPPPTKHIRVTFLSRQTRWRKVMNENELISAMNQIENVTATAIDFHWKKISFPEQLRRTANTDIFVGMHGAGLAHFMFLPEWAAGFEIYNTEDFRCYRDLAHLSGIKYITWENKNKLKVVEKDDMSKRKGAHEKFWNYEFDKDEFIRLFMKAVKHVQLRRKKYHNCHSH